jgi:preprotein translocase subunit YajC
LRFDRARDGSAALLVTPGNHRMLESLARIPLLFAQDGGGGSIWSTLVMVVPITLVFYFLFILPQQQQEKKRKAMIDTLKKNDKVVTTGGLYGTVVSIDAKNDKVVLRVDDERGVKLAFTKASVARVLESSPEKEKAAAELT